MTFSLMKTYRFILVLLILTAFTGCIEIVETITVHADKTGKVSYSLKTNEKGFLLNNLAGLFDISIHEDVFREADKFANQLKKQPGISNIKLVSDKATNNFELNFEFTNSKDLNKAFYSMSGNKKTIVSPGYLKIKNHRVKKINFSPWVMTYLERENIKIPDSYLTAMITYTSIVEVPDEIKNFAPPTVKVSKNQKVARNSYSINDILEEKVNTGMRIKY